jgi:hypothetical protein
VTQPAASRAATAPPPPAAEPRLALRVLPLLATLAGLLLLSPAPAHAQRRVAGGANPAAAAGPGQTVQLPYVMRDSVGCTWDIQMDGSVGDGGNDLYDGGGRLDVNNAVYQSPQAQARFDAATNELTMPPATLGGLTLTRRIAVNVAGGWCRWTEVLENPGNAPVRTTVHLHWDLGSSNQQNRPVDDDKGKGLLGQAIFDGQRGLAMLCAGHGAKVTSRYQMQQGSDQVEQYYDVEVPAKKMIAIAHFQALRPTIDAAAAFISQTKDKDLLEGLSKEVRRALVNFKRSDGLVVGDIELPRAELLDTVELKTGDQYRGQLKDPTFKLDTFHGPVELPIDRVIGMITVGAYRPSQLFITADGEIIGGTLIGDGGVGGGLKFQLSGGQLVTLPLAAISKVGCRKRSGEPEEWRFDKPMAYMRDGQRLAVDPPTNPIAVATLFGPVELKPEWIAAVVIQGEEQAVHQIRLRDGSRFNALVAGDGLTMKLRGASVPSSAGGGPASPDGSSSPGAAADAVKFPLSALARVQLVPAANPDEGGVDLTEVPTLTLVNGDVLVGTVAGTLEVETGFDVLKLNGPEIRGVRRAEPPEGQRALPTEVSVTMWDGAVVSGRMKGDGLTFAPASGVAVTIAAAQLTRYAHPSPTPPPPMVETIRGIVAELSNPDFKARERATAQLRSIGQAAAGVLKASRDAQPAEAQKIIDTILKAVEQEKAAAAKKATAGATPAGPANNAMMMQRQMMMQQQFQMHGAQFDQ